MKRKQFPKFSNARAKEVLGIIHSNVVGKISSPSLGGSNNFVVFTDDFSRHSTLYSIKAKSEALEKKTAYRPVSENCHNKKIKVLRMDNSSAFKSKDFNKYFSQHGIDRQLTVHESPQKGLAQRMNQTLINITRYLIESGADPKF